MQSLRTMKHVTGHAGSFTQCISMQSLMLHVHGAADSDRACVCNEWLRRHKLVPDLGTVSEAAWQPEHELQTAHIRDSAVSHEEHWRGQELYSSRDGCCCDQCRFGNLQLILMEAAFSGLHGVCLQPV